jgi:hypothetical protein
MKLLVSGVAITEFVSGIFADVWFVSSPTDEENEVELRLKKIQTPTARNNIKSKMSSFFIRT